MSNEPDEEGWITVTRYGKKKGAPRTEAEDKFVKDKQQRKRKKKVSLSLFQTGFLLS